MVEKSTMNKAEFKNLEPVLVQTEICTQLCQSTVIATYDRSTQHRCQELAASSSASALCIYWLSKKSQ